MRKRLALLAAAALLVVNAAWAEEGNVDPKVFDDLNGNMVADPDDNVGQDAVQQPPAADARPDLVDLGAVPPDATVEADPSVSTTPTDRSAETM